MGADNYGPARDRVIEGLTALQQIGIPLAVDLNNHHDLSERVVRDMIVYEPSEIDDMTDVELDGYLLLDMVQSVVSFSLDTDFEPGDYANIVHQCAAVAGAAFAATDITEEKLDRGYRVTWNVGKRSFEASGATWTATDLINQGVSGPAKFFDGGWEMHGYLVFLTPDQAEAARAARGWQLYD